MIFLQYLLVERHYSAETKKAYQEDIDDFVNFLKANGGFKDFAHVDHLDVSTYLTELSNRKLSRASVARKMSSLRSFYRYLIRMDQAKSDPFELVETRKSHHHLPDFFYEEEIQSLFATVDGDTPLDQRNRALLEVLYGTGIRVSECANLTLSQIDFDLELLLVHGKGNKDRYVPFGSYCKQALHTYLDDGRITLMEKLDQQHDAVFVNQHGRPITSRGIEYILDQLIKNQFDFWYSSPYVATLFCHALTGSRCGFAICPRIIGARKLVDDPDLHPYDHRTFKKMTT